MLCGTKSEYPHIDYIACVWILLASPFGGVVPGSRRLREIGRFFSASARGRSFKLNARVAVGWSRSQIN